MLTKTNQLYLHFWLISLQGKVLISTKEENVVSKLAIPDPSDMLQPCTYEEADYKLMLHLRHCVETGHTKIMLTTGDSDVVVLAIFPAASMKEEPSFHLLEEVWIEFIVMKKKSYIPIHEVINTLGIKKSLSLPIFHAITGADTTSEFKGKTKKSAWDIWKMYDEVTDIFLALVNRQELDEYNFSIIQRFVCILYDRTSRHFWVNDARKQIFAQGQTSFEKIPPSEAALEQHEGNASGGHIWGQCLVTRPVIPHLQQWG